MKLYPHQERFVKSNPNKALLLWEMGCGKSLAAIEWLKLRTDRKSLLVCPKTISKRWRKELEEHELKTRVVTQDEVKITDISSYTCMVIDEAQGFSSPLFTKARSQRTEKIYYHIKNTPNLHILLLSATPIRSTPYNLHTLSTYLGRYINIVRFRDTYFDFVNRYGRLFYEPKKNWRTEIRPLLESLADIVLMRDCVDIPKQDHIVINIKSPKYVSDTYLEPAKEWHERHRWEQGEAKWKELKRLIDGYQKVIIVCYYREQINDYIKRIGDEREVFVVHGGISDQESVVNEAQASKDCVLIIQSSLGSGFDADTFSVMIFASMGYSYVGYTQMIGRIHRIHNLHENQYYYLLAGPCDKAVYDTMQLHEDFDPIKYLARVAENTEKD